MEKGLVELSERQRKYLRGLGHALNPVLLIGQHGVTPAVIAEASAPCTITNSSRSSFAARSATHATPASPN